MTNTDEPPRALRLRVRFIREYITVARAGVPHATVDEP